MKKLPVALQLYTVRDAMETDFAGVIKSVAAMGYDGVEFAGFGGYSAAELAQLLNETGLTAISSHTQLSDLEKEGMPEFLKELGVSYVAIPWIGEDLRPGASDYPSFVARVNTAGKKLAGLGIALLYHNHAFELEQIDGEYKLDIMYRDLPHLGAEPDCCWLKVGGVDPIKWLKQYAGRAPVVHLKDFVSEPEFAFRPVGDGVQDLKGVIAASVDAGAKWLVVEQDRCPTMSSVDSAKRSLDNIRAIIG